MASSTNSAPVPTVSRSLPDGTLVELLYDPAAGTTSLAVCKPDGSISVEQALDLPAGERLIAYSARNNLLTSGCVKLPSSIGYFEGKAELLADLKAFIRRYADLAPTFEDIAAHYVLLTWVHDGFNELPYLRFQGGYGSGKTRRLLTIGSLCYKAFFASGASTVSPIFHILDAFQGTLVLDEADFRFTDATAELTKVLNNGNVRGLPVLRTMANRHRELNPQAFRVFGPKLIAMRGRFHDQALESRFLTEQTDGRPLRADIPISLPDTLEPEAQALRNRLLAWRFATLSSTRPDAARLIEGFEPRLNQMALPLLSLVDDPDLRQKIAVELIEAYARGQEERSETYEDRIIEALAQGFATAKTAYLPLSEVARRFNEAAADPLELPMSNKRLGWFVRTRLRITTTKSNGIYVIPQTERARINALAERFGVQAPTMGMSGPQEVVSLSESTSTAEAVSAAR